MFDVDKVPRRVGTSTALVAIDPDCCPACGGETCSQTAEQGTLLRHGGYGAVRETSRRWCPSCGWSIVSAVALTNPRGW